MEHQVQSEKRLIRMEQVAGMIGMCKSSIYKMLRAGSDFPKPVQIGPRAVGFVQSEVEAWIQDRIDARDVRRIAA